MNLNSRVFKILCMMTLLLSACTSQNATPSLPPLTAVAVGANSPVEGARQSGATTSRDKVGFILGNLLILSLYSFPMSYAENWAFGDPRKTEKQPKKKSPESIEATESPAEPAQTIGDEALASDDEWTILSARLPQWMRKLPRVTAGLAAGGFLMVAVVIVGAVAFALYYLFSGQADRVNEILPQFSYWFPFALLGMVTDIPFQIIYWEDSRLRVLLRLMIWWFPRIIIIAFVINPPILHGLDPATTALAVLAIDGVLAAFCLGLYTAREQMWVQGIQ